TDAGIRVHHAEPRAVSKTDQCTFIQRVHLRPVHLHERLWGDPKHVAAPCERRGVRAQPDVVKSQRDLVHSFASQRPRGLAVHEQFATILPHGEPERFQLVRPTLPHHVPQLRQRVADGAVVNEAVVHRDEPPAASAIEPEPRVGRPLVAGHDVKLAAPPVSPGIFHAVHRYLVRHRDVLPPEGVDDDLTLQHELARVRDVLPLAAAALRDVRTRRLYAVGRRVECANDGGEPRSALAKAELHLGDLVGDRALDEESHAVIVMRHAQAAMHHVLAAHRAPRAGLELPGRRLRRARRHYRDRRSRSNRLTSGMSALPPVASLTWRMSWPSACCLPPRKSFAATALAAIAASTSASSSVSSLTCPSPRSRTIASGSPPRT